MPGVRGKGLNPLVPGLPDPPSLLWEPGGDPRISFGVYVGRGVGPELLPQRC